MNSYRMLFVILLAIFAVTACKQSEAPPIDDIVGDIVINPLVYNITLEIQWVSPNPDDRWSQGGRELQVQDSVTTRIIVTLDVKDERNQAFEEALTTITAADVTIMTLDDGRLYGRSANETSNYIIYRDYPNYVITIMMVDALSNTIEQSYVNDWERIALEGELIILE